MKDEENVKFTMEENEKLYWEVGHARWAHDYLEKELEPRRRLPDLSSSLSRGCPLAILLAIPRLETGPWTQQGEATDSDRRHNSASRTPDSLWTLSSAPSQCHPTRCSSWHSSLNPFKFLAAGKLQVRSPRWPRFRGRIQHRGYSICLPFTLPFAAFIYLPHHESQGHPRLRPRDPGSPPPQRRHSLPAWRTPPCWLLRRASP
jgi:hypothetical protein